MLRYFEHNELSQQEFPSKFCGAYNSILFKADREIERFIYLNALEERINRLDNAYRYINEEERKRGQKKTEIKKKEILKPLYKELKKIECELDALAKSFCFKHKADMISSFNLFSPKIDRFFGA